MRVRLPVGSVTSQMFQSALATHYWNEPLVAKANRKWQFAKYGDDCIMSNMLGEYCHIGRCHLCHQGDRFFAWRIPARTVKVFGSTINFKAGCNLYRAKLLKDIVKAQKSKATPHYKNTASSDNRWLGDCEPNIELLVDGKSIANINGDYKRGMIKEALKPYTTKVGRGKSFNIPVSEADRLAP